MKCPHCSTAIYENFTTQTVTSQGVVQGRDGKVEAVAVAWTCSHQRCPACHDFIIFLNRIEPPNQRLGFMAYPSSPTRVLPPEVVDPYRQDFSEACKVLSDSTALSRQCLQSILRDKAGTKSKDLNDQIDEVIQAGKVPTHIAEGLHAVRNIGNFAAHTMKSTATGVILDVEPGEAEWNLDVLESLFDFYFVQPAIAAKRKTDLNVKLKAAGKPEIA